MNVVRQKAWQGEENGKVFICKNVSSVDVLRLATEHNVHQIVQETNPKVDSEKQSGLIMMNAPEFFFDFPLSTVLMPTQDPSLKAELKARLFQVSIHQSVQKNDILEQIERVVESVSKRRSLIEDIRLVADELISNALYNAPFVASKTIVNRRSRVDLSPNMAAQVSIGADSDRVVIVCEDRFGSLELIRFLTRIKRCYETGVAEMINHGEGGAGIGSHMIFDTCTSMFCGVEKGRRTVFACVFPIDRSYRNRPEASKNIHVIDR